MRLTREDRAARKDSFRKMSPGEKADYLYTYFKLPIFLGLAALALLCSAVYRQLTKKTVVLYSAHVNVAVGDTLESYLNTDFISSIGEDPQKAEVDFYQGIYLSDAPAQEDHQYSYASRMKVMAAIEAKELDVALMNREAYDIFSHSGYLYELPGLLTGNAGLLNSVEPYLTANTVILEDNAIEYQLGEAARYEAATREAVNGMEVSALPAFARAGFPDHIYLGVIANSPRLSSALQYIEYLIDPARS